MSNPSVADLIALVEAAASSALCGALDMHQHMNDGADVPAHPQRRRRGDDREDIDYHEFLIMGDTSPTRDRDRERGRGRDSDRDRDGDRERQPDIGVAGPANSQPMGRGRDRDRSSPRRSES